MIKTTVSQSKRSASDPLVSVIIPVFNAEAFLREAIDSALAQDYSNVEVIAIDDGSTDASLSILSEYAHDIQVETQRNLGAGHARNTGISNCKGKYIAFLDADDVWHPAKTRIQVAELETKPEIGLVYNNWILVQNHDEQRVARFISSSISPEDIEIDFEKSGWLYCELLLDSIVHTSSAMVRASLVREVGPFDTSLKRGQDYDYWIRLSRLAQFCKLDAELSVYRVQRAGLTQMLSKENYGALVLEKALGKWGRLGPDDHSLSANMVRRRLGAIWYSFGYRNLAAQDYDVAGRSFIRSWKYRPWHVRSFLRYIESLSRSTCRRWRT